MTEELRGSVIGTVYRNDENGWSVLELRSQGDEVTVVGTLPEIGSGEDCVFTGQWVEHPQYGRQFRANTCQIEQPTSLLGIERYLGSGLIKGVGPSTARLIVAAFGKDTLEVLSEHPERLTEVSGIGPKRCQQISESFAAQHQLRRTMLFLQTYGLSASLTAKISKQYQEAAEAIIRDNPYRLIDDIDGVGFKTADSIALSLGFPRDGDYRLMSGVKYLLREFTFSQGHTYVPRAQLVRQAAQLLGAHGDLVENCLSGLILRKELISEILGEDEAIFVPDAWACEKEIAKRLLQLSAASQVMISQHVSEEIKAFERERGIRFSATQRSAVLEASQTGVLIITGGPGTGKTTLLNCILHILGEEEQCLLAAPTGRAAKRMSEATGREAKTIHRLLEFRGEDGYFSRDEDNPLDCSLLVIDEMSMVDVYLMRSLLRAIRPGTRLIMVGDKDQLPSVGPGNVLGDILSSGAVPQVRLTEIFRQEESSMIVVNAHRINRGEMPSVNSRDSDFFFQRLNNTQEVANAIVSLCQERLPRYLNEDSGNIQVLAATKKGAVGVNQLNKLLQDALNPAQDPDDELRYGENIFRLHDKVIHTRNNYQLRWEQPDGTTGEGVFNGDVGRITMVDSDEGTLRVTYDDDRTVTYEVSELDELELAYCLSVHKSQGSEFEAVVMPVVGGPPMLLNRNLFYTAVTRAKRLVTLVGYDQAVRQMVQNNYHSMRYTMLRQRLSEGYGHRP